jgi:sugar lactone lactonase YvrE
MVAGPDGVLWIGNQQGTVARVSVDGKVLETIPLDNKYPLGPMTVGPDGKVWATVYALNDPDVMSETDYLARITP